jgi:hypothetical protein
MTKYQQIVALLVYLAISAIFVACLVFYALSSKEAIAAPKKENKCKPSILYINPQIAAPMDYACPDVGQWTMTVIPRIEYVVVVCECPGTVHTVSYMGIELWQNYTRLFPLILSFFWN